MSATESTLDMDGRYSVAGYGGIAFYLIGYATEWAEETWTDSGDVDYDGEPIYFYNEPEEIEDRQRVRAIMVGDDTVHIVDVDDLTEIGEDDYCSGCGQIGCGWGH